MYSLTTLQYLISVFYWDFTSSINWLKRQKVFIILHITLRTNMVILFIYVKISEVSFMPLDILPIAAMCILHCCSKYSVILIER